MIIALMSQNVYGLTGTASTRLQGARGKSAGVLGRGTVPRGTTHDGQLIRHVVPEGTVLRVAVAEEEPASARELLGQYAFLR